MRRFHTLLHQFFYQRHNRSAGRLRRGDRPALPTHLLMGKFRYIAIWSVIILCSSCSCIRTLVGIVVDRGTREPIALAKIQITNKGYERDFVSDSTGYFEAFLFGGAKCPPIRAEISADGYTAIQVREPKNRDTLVYYLDRLPLQHDNP